METAKVDEGNRVVDGVAETGSQHATTSKTYEVSQDPALIVHQTVSGDGGHLMIVKTRSRLETGKEIIGHLDFELCHISTSGPPLMEGFGSIFARDKLTSLPHIVFSESLSIVLIIDTIYRITLDGGFLSFTAVHGPIPAKDRPEAVRWVVRHHEFLFLARAESTDLGRSLKYEMGVEQINVMEGASHKNTPKSVCELCFLIRPSVEFYVCQVCRIFGVDYEICHKCVSQGSWCKDTSHKLRAKADHDKTISWRHTHSLTTIDLSGHAESTEETCVFSKRIAATVTSCPTVNEDTEQLLWFFDATHVVVCDYKTRLHSICAIRNANPESVTQIYARSVGPYLFAFSIAECGGAVTVHTDSYQIDDLALNGANMTQEPRHIWSSQVQLPEVRSDSKLGFTEDDELARVAYISSRDVVICQPLRYKLRLPDRQQPDLKKGAAVRTEMRHEVSQAGKLDVSQNGLELTSSVPRRFTSAYYSSGLSACAKDISRGDGLVLIGSSGTDFLPVKVDLTVVDDPASPVQSSRLRSETHATSSTDEQISMAKEILHETAQKEATKSLGRFRVQRGALCSTCSAVLQSSVLLNDLSLWEPVPIKKLIDHFHEHGKVSHGGSGYQSHTLKHSQRIFVERPGYTMENQADNDGKAAWPEVRTTQLFPNKEVQSGGDDQDSFSGAIQGAEVRSKVLYEHHAHHASLQKLAESVLEGCHLCSLFIASLEADHRRPVQDALNVESRKAFASGTDSSEADPQPKNFDTNQTSCGTLLSDRAGVEWLTSESHLIMRVEISSEGKANFGELCLYRALDTEDARPEFLAKIGFGLAEEYQDVVKSSGPPTEQKSALEKLTRQLVDPFRFTGSTVAMSLARHWLRTCCHGHCCAPIGVISTPPTRVIDVGPSDGTQVPRLYITSPRDDTGMEYVTLSHCWGRGNAVVLRAADLEAQDAPPKYPLETLPQTFRDAVIICRALNVRYLWIDSLCIVQEGDNGADWEREAPKMAGVYGNALCTVAALSSTSVRSGCFAYRNALGTERLLFQGNKKGLSFMVNGKPYHPEMKQHPLNSRGWVFQERMLSQRILGFSDMGLSWECGELRATDLYVQGIDPKRFDSSPDTMAKLLFKQATLPLLRPLTDRLARISFLKAWYEILEGYTPLDLTVPTDKIMAVTGIAQVIQRATGFTWIHGLWHDPGDSTMFLSQLLWNSPIPYNQQSIPFMEDGGRGALVPKFSWAAMSWAVDHRVTFHPRHINMDAGSWIEARPRSYWVPVVDQKTNSQTFHQCILEFGRLVIEAQPQKTLGGCVSDPSEKLLLEYRTELLQFIDQSENDGPMPPLMRPSLILRGHIRNVTLVKASDHEELWNYPWREGEDGEKNTGQTIASDDKSDGDDFRTPYKRIAWFFPDVSWSILDSEQARGPGIPVKCLTIARWQRAWDERWYCAGIVLLDPGLTNGFKLGSQMTEAVPILTRYGYFEHSWESRDSDWEKDGDEEIVMLN